VCPIAIFQHSDGSEDRPTIVSEHDATTADLADGNPSRSGVTSAQMTAHP
jgi:hypothetical protein